MTAADAIDSTRRSFAALATGGALQHGRVVDVGCAALVAVPPVACLLAIEGLPSNLSGWAALLGPLAAAASVLVCRRHLLVAFFLLTVAIGCVPAGDLVYERQATSPWVEGLSLTPLIAVAVVYCALGASLGLAPSLCLLIPSILASEFILGLDVPFTMIALGWWMVGRVLWARHQVALNLEARATELAEERQRYTAEAIRLERTKIARELHDVVAHCMTVLVIQSRAGQQLLGSDPAAAREAMDSIAIVAAEAASDIGALVELMDPDRSRPLTRNLLDDMISRAAATGTTIVAEVVGDPSTLDGPTAVAAHRLVQESLTNALRYAPGALIRIELDCGRPSSLVVTNDRPTVPDRLANTVSGRLGSGNGLIGMCERVAAVGGRVNWGPTPADGWRVAATFGS